MTHGHKKRATIRVPKTGGVRRRYGIGEWYGKLLVELDTAARIDLAKFQFQPKRERPVIVCPFRSSEGANLPCTKEGGVCSLRLYESDLDGHQVRAAVEDAGALVTLCPYRFQEARVIHEWIGKTLLGTDKPLVASEIGFLEQETEKATKEGVALKRDVGRIDLVLAHPSRSLQGWNWCAVETQAVYFSGRSMKKEFRVLRNAKDQGVPFPAAHRRPDFRSSGPKRLMPQLQIKVPTLRRWGKKMAVVVDRSFYHSLGKVEEVGDVSSCDIAWFVVRYEEGNGRASLRPDSVRLTTLERAVEGLTGGHPVALAEFESRIREKLGQNLKDPKPI